MKKLILVVIMSLVLVLSGCSKKVAEDPSIKIYTRDATSGTRDGFFTTIGFKEAVSDNSKLKDFVEVANNGEMISSIVNDEYGIGYISLSSLDGSGVKGLNYNSVEPTEDNVINGTYKLTRNFNYNTRADYATEKERQIVEAFVAYLSTKDAKATISGADGIVEIKTSDPSWEAIKANYPIILEDNSGVTIRFGGSTSVEKVAKKLSAEFSTKCGNFNVEHNHTGSSDAYKATQGSEKDGSNSLHIGFASREYKLTSDEQLEEGTYGFICKDAIVAVVNNNNPLTNVTTETLKNIYNSTVTKWNDLNK